MAAAVEQKLKVIALRAQAVWQAAGNIMDWSPKTLALMANPTLALTPTQKAAIRDEYLAMAATLRQAAANIPANFVWEPTADELTQVGG